jgi:hypothetical protein
MLENYADHRQNIHSIHGVVMFSTPLNSLYMTHGTVLTLVRFLVAILAARTAEEKRKSNYTI